MCEVRCVRGGGGEGVDGKRTRVCSRGSVSSRLRASAWGKVSEREGVCV